MGCGSSYKSGKPIWPWGLVITYITVLTQHTGRSSRTCHGIIYGTTAQIFPPRQAFLTKSEAWHESVFRAILTYSFGRTKQRRMTQVVWPSRWDTVAYIVKEVRSGLTERHFFVCMGLPYCRQTGYPCQPGLKNLWFHIMLMAGWRGRRLLPTAMLVFAINNKGFF